uniref:non-specific serine/threonine protein kinase n=1 Tax=Anthurium amnicola TaxID=1678845 RepID=A0A1D1Y6S7_9ARAE
MSGLRVMVSVGIVLLHTAVYGDDSFVFHGFREANLSLDGAAKIEPNGLLTLTNATKGQTGHAFHSTPLRFRGAPGGGVLSFSTTFVFAIVPVSPEVASYGMALAISPTKELPRDPPGPYMGLFNSTSDGSAANHVLAVELDTTVHSQFRDVDDNHVGIDVNGVTSFNSSSAAYYVDGRKQNLTLASGSPMQLWVEYDGGRAQLAVALAPLGRPQPEVPLLSSSLNLSGLFLEPMYVGFSASGGKALTSQYVLGWSFRVNGKAERLDLSRLPPLPRTGEPKQRNTLAIWLPIALSVSLLMVAAVLTLVAVRKRKFAEVREDWELEYGPHRFSYKDLYRATKGFRASDLLGVGGFGEVYRGVLPVSKMEVAVKKVSHDSRQGMREFVAEIVTIGRLRHRNLVQLLGYSRRRGGLFLVYDFMPNGSLDKLLFDRTRPTLSWVRRFHAIKGVAAGLLYLHEEWEQVVIHRDVKASSIYLDEAFEPRLSDFGLAGIVGSDLEEDITRGSPGYTPPEFSHTENSSATPKSDVFGFGVVLFELVTGKKPVGDEYPEEEEPTCLVNWVRGLLKRNEGSSAIDPKIRETGSEKQMEAALRIGYLCTAELPSKRPSMQQIVGLLKDIEPVADQ